MKTEAQERYRLFQENQLKSDYNFDLMTLEQQQSEMIEYTKLKIAAQKEIEENNHEQELLFEQEKENEISNLKNKLLDLGYKCDNSIDDWLKLFNRPEIFGINWRIHAQSYFDNSTGFEYFCNISKNTLGL